MLVLSCMWTLWAKRLTLTSFISLGLYGIIYMFIARRLWIPAGILFILQYVGYAVYAVFRGVPSPVSLALGIAKTPSLINLFVLGLVAGSLSFGGAYTAIPFVHVEAVLKGAWLPQRVFIDCIAIGNVLPAPLVIFATFVGFQGGNIDDGLGRAFAGAVVITLGMFFPCFLFTIAGHSLLEKLVHNKVRIGVMPPHDLLYSIIANFLQVPFELLRRTLWSGDWCHCRYQFRDTQVEHSRDGAGFLSEAGGTSHRKGGTIRNRSCGLHYCVSRIVQVHQ